MPATMLDTTPDVAAPAPLFPGSAASVPHPVRVRRPPSRRRRRVTGRLSRLAALCAMGAWVAVGLMPVAAVLLAVYG